MSAQRNSRPRRTPTADDVIHAATRHYLRGEAIDMSSLASELGLSRATLYRRVGNYERLVGLVLAERTQRTFEEAVRTVHSHGQRRVLDVLDRFMRAVLDADPLRRFVARDPVLYIRVATAPGPVEQRSTELIAGVLEEESRAGRLAVRVPTGVLAQAIVRTADSFMYAHLLGGQHPEVETALRVVELLLDGASVTADGPGGAR